MEAARQRVEAKVKERMAQVALHETLVNMPRWFVTEPPIHLSLNELRSEQYAAEDGWETESDTFLCPGQKIKGLTRHCLASSIQPDPLCRISCSTHSSVGNTGPSPVSKSGGINWRIRYTVMRQRRHVKDVCLRRSGSEVDWGLECVRFLSVNWG